MTAVDYENSNNQVEDFLPTDAVGLVLWLDADDNQTLFKSNSFVDNVEPVILVHPLAVGKKEQF